MATSVEASIYVQFIHSRGGEKGNNGKDIHCLPEYRYLRQGRRIVTERQDITVIENCAMAEHATQVWSRLTSEYSLHGKKYDLL